MALVRIGVFMSQVGLARAKGTVKSATIVEIDQIKPKRMLSAFLIKRISDHAHSFDNLARH